MSDGEEVSGKSRLAVMVLLTGKPEHFTSLIETSSQQAGTSDDVSSLASESIQDMSDDDDYSQSTRTRAKRQADKGRIMVEIVSAGHVTVLPLYCLNVEGCLGEVTSHNCIQL